MINRRETRKLGRILGDDLRKRSPYTAGWPEDQSPAWRA